MKVATHLELPPEATRVRVAFVDDHPLLLAGLSSFFSTNPRYLVVGLGENAESAVALARAQAPDVMTLDLRMPGDVGAAIGTVLDELPTIRLLIYSAYPDVDLALSALDAGAHGFILKGSRPTELFEAIDAVRRGALFISPEFSPRLLAGFRQRSQEERERSSAKLSPREQQLVQGLLEAKSNKEIARALNLSEKTIKHYMTNLMNKLKVKSRLEVVLATKHLLAPRD